MSVTVVSWNIAKKREPWRELARMDVDVALLQEAGPPPEDVARLGDATLPPAEGGFLDIGPQEAWDSHSWNSDWWHGRGWNALYDRWPMVVKLSDRVEVEWFKQIGPVWGNGIDEIAVSGIGTITAARVTPKDGTIEPFIAVSMYGRWLGPHPSTVGDWIYSDASAHRIISDLSTFIGYYNRPSEHRILAAGDLNMSFKSANQFDHRAQTVLDRFQAIGLDYLGPQYPAGRRADPIPPHLNEASLDVPTYYNMPSNTPIGASVQLDHVFASRGFHEDVSVRAMNGVDEWGSSDHCRVLIDVGDGVEGF